MKLVVRFIFFLAIAATSASVSADISVQYHDDREDRRIQVAEMNKTIYVPISAVSEIFSADKYWRQESRQMALHIGDKRFILIVDNPIIESASGLHHLRTPVLYRSGTIWTPIQFIESVIDSFVPEDVVWHPEINLLSLTIPKDNITILDMEFTAEYQETRVIIHAKKPLRFLTDKSKPGHLIVEIKGGQADAQKFTFPDPNGFIIDTSAENRDEDFVLDFHYHAGAKSYRIESYDDPPRIEAHFFGYDVDEEPEPPQIRDRKDNTTTRNYVSDFDLIVIDPGHGGKDPGAIGPNGTYEKDITLDIAQQVVKQIEKELGVRAVLTRTDDSFVSLRKRTEMANRMNADLFISIHCNASPSPKAHGTETYFLSLAKTNEARAVAARENASLKFEMPGDAVETMGDLDFILWDLAQYEYLEESSMLAEIAHEELAKKLDITGRRVGQAPFYVLNGAYMPAILVETAFISNKEEEKLLNTARFRERASDAVVSAIGRYKRLYDKKMARSQ
ncbi:MAG: hypothetical protein B6244_12620 [Candidatus Cloacimonetes bacterium 4572_55]|nr:MAG: hypothetical protein B6244_12620 [Candidatus Cloacimonetes bacterium 4572_55]